MLVWKAYPDGRTDELVRGVDIVGTPLAALNRMKSPATGRKSSTAFAEPNLAAFRFPAVAPAMLFSEMEVQKRAHSRNRPPILPSPAWDNSGQKSITKSGGVL